jgi:hypothetical protein
MQGEKLEIPFRKFRFKSITIRGDGTFNTVYCLGESPKL